MPAKMPQPLGGVFSVLAFAIAHQSVYYPFTDTSLTAPDWDSGLMPGVDRKAGQLMAAEPA